MGLVSFGPANAKQKVFVCQVTGKMLTEKVGVPKQHKKLNCIYYQGVFANWELVVWYLTNQKEKGKIKEKAFQKDMEMIRNIAGDVKPAPDPQPLYDHILDVDEYLSSFNNTTTGAMTIEQEQKFCESKKTVQSSKRNKKYLFREISELPDGRTEDKETKKNLKAFLQEKGLGYGDSTFCTINVQGEDNDLVLYMRKMNPVSKQPAGPHILMYL